MKRKVKKNANTVFKAVSNESANYQTKRITFVESEQMSQVKSCIQWAERDRDGDTPSSHHH